MTESDGTRARSAAKIFGLQPPKNLEKSLDFEENCGNFVEKKSLTFFFRENCGNCV